PLTTPEEPMATPSARAPSVAAAVPALPTTRTPPAAARATALATRIIAILLSVVYETPSATTLHAAASARPFATVTQITVPARMGYPAGVVPAACSDTRSG